MPAVVCYNVISVVPPIFGFEVINMDRRTLRRFPLNENDVINLFMAGKTYRYIADKYGCSVHVIQKCMQRNIIADGKNWRLYLWRKAHITPDELLAMYNSGLWKNEIAAKTGISEGLVGKYLVKMGVPLAENRSDAMRLRLERAGPDGRANLVEAAHNAVRGMIRTEQNLINAANGRERVGRFGCTAERDLYFMLQKRGIDPVPQKALWKYSIDLTIGNIAVEITGRGRKPEQIPALIERIKYILNSGFMLIYVWAGTTIPVETGAADYIVTTIQEASCDPSLVGQYRVIRRDGKLMAAGCVDDDQFTGIFSPVSGTYSKV